MNLEQFDPEIFETIQLEADRQISKLELIASENFVSPAVREAMGSVMTNKYAEGYPKKRYYKGCEFVDKAESLARKRAKELFQAEHANVQPHSGSQANMAVYFTLLKPGDTIMGMNLSHGGHLTHGSPVNFSGLFYNVVPYGVDLETEQIDYNEVEKLALECKPKMIMIGASAYSRIIDFERFKTICDKVQAYMVVDMAHIAGLVAAGLHPSPVPFADFVTSTTHKTLRGPRGGLILCQKKYAKQLDKMIFPGIQGGPLMHVIAAKAVAFKEALAEDFKTYIKQVLTNAAELASTLIAEKLTLVSGGTDNHLVLVNLTDKGLTGKLIEKSLDQAAITTNKNTVPNETQSPFITSGIRLGTPALTTRGMKEAEMKEIGKFIARVVASPEDEANLAAVREDVLNLCRRFPDYV